ncbi:spore germination protein [Oceanobacillus iheyensis]|uniref:spore germination protein n=1 Tax=Oceanobacillus TaxID=182709 RepID=UPI0021A8FED9|nr:spore germination protein [Oceanobacillus kimchii]MCT1578605.1 spore germination protein [Oceanobacillus kimchii]MCT2136346.1 spore germination protein [Oceanobacillus kimchii]
MNRFRSKNNNPFPLTIEELKKILEKQYAYSSDLSFTVYEHEEQKIAVFYIQFSVDEMKLENYLLETLLNTEEQLTNQLALKRVPLSNGGEYNDFESILDYLIQGHVFVYFETENSVLGYSIPNKIIRNLETTETESLVLGPKVAFTESLSTNINIIRYGLKSKDLVMEKHIIGRRDPREVRLIYLRSIANDTDINTFRQRIKALEVDFIDDTSVLTQYLEDNSTTVFPQFLITELPDRLIYNLSRGKIGVLSENSPNAIIAPSTFFSFFESTEDIYMRWNSASFIRILRFISFFISTLLTPLYVAAVTFHYEIVPTPVLITLGESRAAVPFPPIFEALFLELMIELLREAGARLPTKVGQTIGIVGGVVIGTAAVEAGITSNVLVIIVALSALASFTTPNYIMGTTARVIRFPMIIFAGLLGLIGIVFCTSILLIHLLKLTSLGRPYFSPVYPFRWKDFNKSLFRSKPDMQQKRFISYQPKDKYRFKKIKKGLKKDIDE